VGFPQSAPAHRGTGSTGHGVGPAAVNHQPDLGTGIGLVAMDFFGQEPGLGLLRPRLEPGWLKLEVVGVRFLGFQSQRRLEGVLEN